MDTHVVSQQALERMVTAVEKVRERLLRTARALEEAGIPYAEWRDSRNLSIVVLQRCH